MNTKNVIQYLTSNAAPIEKERKRFAAMNSAATHWPKSPVLNGERWDTSVFSPALFVRASIAVHDTLLESRTKGERLDVERQGLGEALIVKGCAIQRHLQALRNQGGECCNQKGMFNR